MASYEPRREWNYAAHVRLQQRAQAGAVGAGDLKQAEAASRLEHSIELSKGERQIADVAQGVAHAEEIGRGVGGGNRLSAARGEPHTWGDLGCIEHSGTRVDTQNSRRVADDARRLTCNQTGSHPDVEDRHPRAQAGTPQSAAPVP